MSDKPADPVSMPERPRVMVWRSLHPAGADELHLVLLPTLIAGAGTPTTFDGPPLAGNESPTPMQLVGSRVSSDGAVWLHYEVGSGGHTPANG